MHEIGVQLSLEHKKNIIKANYYKKEITINIIDDCIRGSDILIVSSFVNRRYEKCRRRNKGVDITLSKNYITKQYIDVYMNDVDEQLNHTNPNWLSDLLELPNPEDQII